MSIESTPHNRAYYNIKDMTDAELARNSAIYQHKANVAEGKEDWADYDRFTDIVEMIEAERERRAGREPA